MRCFVLVAALAGAFVICQGREVDSHISIYVPPTGPEAAAVSVYKQIANNIAEKITDPIWKFFGFDDSKEKTTHKEIATTKAWKTVTNQSTEATSAVNNTEGATTENRNNITTQEWTTAQGNENIEDNSTKELTWEFVSDSSNETNTTNSTTSSSDLTIKHNNLEVTRDIEEILPEKVNKTKVKPEKYVFSTTIESEPNDTINEISDDEFFVNFDAEQEKPKETGLIYFLEMIGSVFQLAWGAFSSIFKPKSK